MIPGTEPIAVHCIEQCFVKDDLLIFGDNRIDAAVRAKGGAVAFGEPAFDFIRGIDALAVEAAAAFAVFKGFAVFETAFMEYLHPFRMCLGIGTLHTEALIVLRRIYTQRFARGHADTKLSFGKIDRGEDRGVGVPLTASGTSDLTDFVECRSGHTVGKPPFFSRKRGGAGYNRDEHSRGDSGTAGSPEAAGTARNLPSP